MKTIIVTGTPGTGKTTIAKKLALRLNLHYLDVNNLIRKYKISEGYDKKRKTKIVDADKLSKVLTHYIDFFKKHKFIDETFIENKVTGAKTSTGKSLKNIKKYGGIIVDSHLSHYLPRKYVDACIVAKCSIRELNKRLKKRKYPKNKVEENLQSEIFDVCYNEAFGRKHKIIVVDTAKSFNINEIIRKIGG